MVQFPDQTAGRVWPLLRTIAAGGVITLALFAVTGWTLLDSRSQAWDGAEQNARNLSLSLERNLDRTLATLDLSMRAAAQGMQIPGFSTLNPVMRQSVLFDGAIGAEGIGGVVITDRSGDVLYASSGEDGHATNLADHPSFQLHKASNGLGLTVSKPIRDPGAGSWTIDLTRRLSAADGTFTGVVSGRLEVSYIKGLFQSLDIGPGGNISLFSTDGTLVGRHPSTGGDIGRDMSASTLFQRFARQPAGTYEATAVFDGVQRLYSYRQVGHFPLLVSVGLSRADIFAEWWHRTLVLSVVVGLLALLSVVFAVALARSYGRWRTADQSARASAQEAQTLLARLDALFINSPDAMFVVKQDTRGLFSYETVNPVWQMVTGASVYGNARQPLPEFWPEKAIEDTLAAWNDCICNNRQASYTLGFERHGKSTEWEVSVAPVLGPEDGTRRLIGVARDITVRRQLEAGLRQAHRMEAVGQLAAGVAHDFNNMLHAIMGSLELLSDQAGLDVEGRECLQVADEAARRCSLLVHRLLAFSRKQPLRATILDPVQVASENATLFTRLLGDEVSMQCDVQHGIWSIQADATQLNSCLLNLVLNARDASKGKIGGVIRFVCNNRSQHDALRNGFPARDYVCFTVQDQGCGMTAEVLARATEPFFTTKGVGEGSGLGLSMVQGFAKQSGGDLRIVSTPGEGTTVALWLPREQASRSTITVAGVELPLPQGRGTILVVDDEPMVRNVLSRVLEKAGFTAVAVDSGEQALEILEAGRDCEMLVTDQSMPGLNGSQLIQAAAHLRPDMPSMLITGFDRVSGMDELPSSVLVVRKPVTRAVFLEKVMELLSVRGIHDNMAVRAL